MNQPHAIQALREALKQYGGWEQLHRACVLVDGVLVLQKQKAPAVKLVPLSARWRVNIQAETWRAAM